MFRWIPFRQINYGQESLEEQNSEQSIQNLLSDDAAVELYQNATNITNINITDSTSQNVGLQDFRSSNDFGFTCRICRYLDDSAELIECPCKCTGTVGYVHRKCLQRWIKVRRNTKCEICKEDFNVQADKRNYKLLFASLFKPKYFGSIMRNIINLLAVSPLVYITMNQLIYAMENFNENPSTAKMVIFGPAMLLGTSIYFFLYFDWAFTCLLKIRNILMHWWHFGDDEDEEFIPSIENFDDLWDLEF